MQSESSPVHSIISRWKEKEGENESKRRSSNAHEGFRPETPTLNEKKTTFGISSLRPKKRIMRTNTSTFVTREIKIEDPREISSSGEDEEKEKNENKLKKKMDIADLKSKENEDKYSQNNSAYDANSKYLNLIPFRNKKRASGNVEIFSNHPSSPKNTLKLKSKNEDILKEMTLLSLNEEKESIELETKTFLSPEPIEPQKEVTKVVSSVFDKSQKEPIDEIVGRLIAEIHSAARYVSLFDKYDNSIVNKLQSQVSVLEQNITTTYLEIDSISSHLLKWESRQINRSNRNSLTLTPDYTLKVLPTSSASQIIHIIEVLRHDSHYLADAFARTHSKNDKIIENNGTFYLFLSQTIILSLFRGVISPLDQYYFFKFLSDMCEYQIRLSLSTLKEGSITFTPAFAIFIRSYIRFSPMWEFFQLHLRSVVCETLLQIEFSKPELRNAVIEKCAVKFIQSCIDLEHSIPLGIRILLESVWNVSTELSLNDLQKFNLLKEVLFNNFFLCCIESPSLYTGMNVIGLQVALQNIPSLKTSITNKLTYKDSILVQFLERLKGDNTFLMNQLSSEVHNPIYHNQAFRRIIITKHQFWILIEILKNAKETVISDIPTSRLWKTTDYFRKMIDDFISQEEDTLDSPFQKIHASSFLDVLLTVKKRSSTMELLSFSKKNSGALLKKQLITLLPKFPFIPVGPDLNSTANNLIALCTSQSQLPLVAQSQHIFDQLIKMDKEELIKFLTNIRDDLELKRKQPRQQVEILTFDWIQDYYAQLSSFKKRWEGYLNTVKVEMFDMFSFHEMKSEFTPLFLKTFEEKNSCDCSILNKTTCENCGIKSSFIREFLTRVSAKMQESSLWKKSSEEFASAYQQLQHNLLDDLYECTFPYLKEDDIHLAELEKVEVTPEVFQIPEKYLNAYPWTSVVEELRKMNCFRSPHYKFQCISKSWEILSNLVSLVDEAGPDSCYPIMAYIICTNKVPNPFSNLHYVALYAQLSDIENARLLAFRVVLKAVRQTISSMVQKLAST